MIYDVTPLDTADQNLILIHRAVAADGDNRLLLPFYKHARHREVAEKQHRLGREIGRNVGRFAAESYGEAEIVGSDRTVRLHRRRQPAACTSESADRLRIPGGGGV